MHSSSEQVDMESNKVELLQRIDPLWSDIYKVKESGNGSNREKRRIQSHYVLQKGKLYKRILNGDEARYLLCVPQQMISDVLHSCHDCPLAGHLGQKKTYHRISQKYFWPTMKADVEEYVRTCHKCQMRKVGNNKPYGMYQPLPLPNEPFQEVSLDLVGPLVPTAKGNRYILTANCRLTKFAFAKALPDIKDVTVMTAFTQEFLYKYGVCEVLLTDRGTNLCSKYFEEVLKMHGIEHRKTTAFHPETNGQTECFNKTLANMIAISQGKHSDRWDEYISSSVFAYNTSRHDASQMTPYYLAFGRQPAIPLDQRIGYEELSDGLIKRQDQIDKVTKARIEVKKRLEKDKIIIKLMQTEREKYLSRKRANTCCCPSDN